MASSLVGSSPPAAAFSPTVSLPAIAFPMLRATAVVRSAGAKRFAGAFEKCRAGRCKRHPSACSLQQLDAENVLNLANLSTENLLGHVDSARCGSEAGFLGHRHEVPHVPKLDVHWQQHGTVSAFAATCRRNMVSGVTTPPVVARGGSLRSIRRWKDLSSVHHQVLAFRRLHGKMSEPATPLAGDGGVKW